MRLWSFRDELKEREPSRVNDEFFGGAYGCPGCYFENAPLDDHDTCRPLSAKRCRECWEKPYNQERWKPDDDQ